MQKWVLYPILIWHLPLVGYLRLIWFLAFWFVCCCAMMLTMMAIAEAQLPWTSNRQLECGFQHDFMVVCPPIAAPQHAP